MENKRELSMDEMDKVSGGNGNGHGINDITCPNCRSNEMINEVFNWVGWTEYQCGICGYDWTAPDN